MPFYWSQRPNLKYKPKPIISKTTNHVRAAVFMCFLTVRWEQSNAKLLNFVQMDGFQRHFDSQLLIYGKQTLLNLVRIVNNLYASLPLQTSGRIKENHMLCFRI